MITFVLKRMKKGERKMKKIIILILMICSFIFVLSGCSDVADDFSSTIENLKLNDTVNCKGCKIKFFDSDYDPSVSYYITPNGFEMEKLEERGYYMEIKVTYNVYYKKDYDVPWDIGYSGSPDYDISIRNSDYMGKSESDLSTSTSKVSRDFTLRASIADIKNQRWILSFSTNNSQNIIYFSDIVVTYRCYK